MKRANKATKLNEDQIKIKFDESARGGKKKKQFKVNRLFFPVEYCLTKTEGVTIAEAIIYSKLCKKFYF